MPSDAKKKRDLQKKVAAKQRQAQRTNKPNGANSNENDEDLIDDNEDDEVQNENENPSTPTTNGTSTEVDSNVKSVIQNLDLLSMVEKANADARSCTGKRRQWLNRLIESPDRSVGVLGSHPRGRDVHINQFSVTFYGQEILSDADLEMNSGRRYGFVGLNGSGKSTILACIGNREVSSSAFSDKDIHE